MVSGRYLYGDVCSGAVHSVRIGKTGMRADHGLGMRIPYLDSFGRDGRGRGYALSLNGGIYRIGR